MKHRKLRIAWSVGWGIVAVLLVVLWVRSYWRIDAAFIAHSHSAILTLGSLYIDAGVAFPADVPRRDYGPGALYLYEWAYDPQIDVTEQRATLPLWGLVLSIAACGSLSWLRGRFTLRTLLIATTLVAVGLGLIVWVTG